MNTQTFVTAVVAVGGLFFLVFGVWAFIDPQSFYDEVATFPPYNRHFIHDIGAFQIGIGVTLLLALRWSDARFVVLAGGAVGAVLHLVAHVVDHDLGGADTDVPIFATVAVLLVIAAVLRWRALRAEGG